MKKYCVEIKNKHVAMRDSDKFHIIFTIDHKSLKMNASNKLCEELLCRYSDFEPIEEDKFTGCKLAEKKNLNYYSAVTGLFRYKARSVSDNSYSSLYEKHWIFYDPIMKDKISIFRKKDDAIKFLSEFPNIVKYKTELVLLEITISGNLQSVKCSNKYHKDLQAVAGCVMEKITEVESIYESNT